MSHFSVDSQSSKLAGPFTSINLKMDYIKNNAMRKEVLNRRVKNKSIEVIYSDARSKQGKMLKENSYSSRLSSHSKQRVSSNNRNSNDSQERSYIDQSELLLRKINRASKFKESIFKPQNEMKERIRLLEIQNHNLAEMNNYLKEQVDLLKGNSDNKLGVGSISKLSESPSTCTGCKT